MHNIRTVNVPPTRTGESPVWCDKTRSLWYVDIHGRTLWQYRPETGRHRHWLFDGLVCGVALTDGAAVAVVFADAIGIFDPDVGALLRSIPLPVNGRLNDCAVSRNGTLHVAALTNDPAQKAALYQWRDGLPVRQILFGLYVGNGLAFSPCNTTLYLSDSNPHVSSIWSFDHDPATGDITNRHTFFHMPMAMGRPDGGSVDAEGGYWSAAVDGGAIIRFSPCGEIDRIVSLPVKKPTKICFGGDDLTTIFVTSIDTGSGGALLSLDLGVRGLVEPRVKLREGI